MRERERERESVCVCVLRSRELEADDIRGTTSPTLKGMITHIVSARQLVRAETATKGVRRVLAVTHDTCFHEKEGVKLISTYPQTLSIDSASLQSTTTFKRERERGRERERKHFRPTYPVFSP